MQTCPHGNLPTGRSRNAGTLNYDPDQGLNVCECADSGGRRLGGGVRGGSPGGRFEVFFQPGEVGRHLLLCFAADEHRDEKFADAVAFEVDSDGQPGPGLRE